MIIANPTAASAAATAIIKNTKACPFWFPRYDENVINTRFTEFNISSIHMNTIIAFLLIRTPITPIVKSMRDNERKKFMCIYKNTLI